jgi:hypothetical protein
VPVRGWFLQHIHKPDIDRAFLFSAAARTLALLASPPDKARIDAAATHHGKLANRQTLLLRAWIHRTLAPS